MTAADVLVILLLFRKHAITVHIDGGWGVDALLGKQTRHHADLDIAVPHDDVPKLRDLLAARGFQETPRDDAWACNFVLADGAGRELDVHSYRFDRDGNNIYGVPYPAESLTGRGRIAGYDVDCIEPSWMVRFHTGYELDENDFRDVAALCAKFHLELPHEYGRFQGGSYDAPES